MGYLEDKAELASRRSQAQQQDIQARNSQVVAAYNQGGAVARDETIKSLIPALEQGLAQQLGRNVYQPYNEGRMSLEELYRAGGISKEDYEYNRLDALGQEESTPPGYYAVPNKGERR